MVKLNLPGLHGGISQQSPNLRSPNQHTDATNVVFDLYEGIRGPRWGTKLIEPIVSRLGGYDAPAGFGRPWEHLGFMETTDGTLWNILWRTAPTTGDNFPIRVVNMTTGAYADIATDVDSGSQNYTRLNYTPDDLTARKSYLKMYPILDTAVILNSKAIVKEKKLNDSYGTYCAGLLRIPQLFEGRMIRVTAQAVASKTLGKYTAGDVIMTSQHYLGAVGAGATTDSIKAAIATTLTAGPIIADPIGEDMVSIGLRGDTVSYGGNHYECIRSHKASASILPTNTTYWQQISAPYSVDAWASGTTYLNVVGINKGLVPTIHVTSSSGFEIITHSCEPAYTGESVVSDGYTLYPDAKFAKTTPSYEKLPPYQLSAAPDMTSTWVFKITEGYFVKIFSGNQYYEECAAPGHAAYLDKATMPHELRWSSVPGAPNLGWSYAAVGLYSDNYRRVGDSASAPSPGFVGRTITALLYYRNRLCFLSDNYVSMSKANSYYDWFPDTATEVIDSDPISVFPTHTKYTKLLWAKPFNKSLLLIGTDKQYVLHSGYDALGPQTVAIDEATAYEVLPNVEPLSLPASLMIPINNNPYAGIIEYPIGDNSVAMDGALLTSVVPEFIPSDFNGMVYVPNHQLVLLYKRGTAYGDGGDGSKIVWVLKLSRGNSDGGQEVYNQVAWSKWEFNWPVRYMYVHNDSQVYIVLDQEYTHVDLTYSTRVPYDAYLCMDTSRSLDLPQLDEYVELEVDPNAQSNKGIGWVYPYTSNGNFTDRFHAIDAVTFKELPIALLPSSYTGRFTVDTTDMTDVTRAICGYSIPWDVTLSPLIVRDDNGLPRNDVAATIENIQLDWGGGEFVFEQTGQGLPTRTRNIYSPEATDVAIGLSAVSYLESNPTRIPVMAPAKRAVLKLKGTSYVPSKVNNISYNLDIIQDWG